MTFGWKPVDLCVFVFLAGLLSSPWHSESLPNGNGCFPSGLGAIASWTGLGFLTIVFLIIYPYGYLVIYFYRDFYISLFQYCCHLAFLLLVCPLLYIVLIVSVSFLARTIYDVIFFFRLLGSFFFVTFSIVLFFWLMKCL